LSGKLEEAIEHLTKAILLNPTSAIMYGTRGMMPLPLTDSFIMHNRSLLNSLSAMMDALLASHVE
jgi:hypothetical protein